MRLKAYRFAREHPEGEMKRQKKYHDAKLCWETFEQGDKDLVYFLHRTIEKSPNFMNFWQGPFEVVTKNSHVTYELRRPSDKKPQIVHVDRTRSFRTQKLVGEIPDRHYDQTEIFDDVGKSTESNVSVQNDVVRESAHDSASETSRIPYIVDSG